MFRVLGYAGSDEPTTLYECDDLTNAIRWVKNYVAKGDWGGYDEIHVKNAEGVTETMFVREQE